jgi:hypothetical protein
MPARAPGDAPSAPLERPASERVLAWLYTGPLGRLYGTLADIAELWVKWMLMRARTRLSRPRA